MLEKLTPAPHGSIWVTEQIAHGAGDWVIFEQHDGNRNPKIGYFHEKADAEFYALARSAYDVMMRRGWWAVKAIAGWTVHFKNGCAERWMIEFHKQSPFVWCDDPFTAIVEADKWYRENVEKQS